MSILGIVKSIQDQDLMRDILESYYSVAARAIAAATDYQDSDQFISLCDDILEARPGDSNTRIILLRHLAANGKIEQALCHLRKLKEQNLDPQTLVRELFAVLPEATRQQQDALNRADLDEANLILCHLMELSPDVLMFQKALVNVQRLRVIKAHEMAKTQDRYNFEILQTCLETCERLGDLEEEAQIRLEISRHPLDKNRHRILQIHNVVSALARFLGVDHHHFSKEELDVIQELLERGQAICAVPNTDTNPENLYYEDFCRLQMASINLDAIFGPAIEKTAPLPTVFADGDGNILSIEDVQARSRAVNAQAAFFVSTSPEYFDRYARVFASSVLKACDCGCLVIICVCTDHERMPEIVRSLDLKDPRLIFCSDNFDPASEDFKIYSPKAEAVSTPGPHYATAAMLRSDWVLDFLKLPVFLTGIDTVLQRGIADLLETHQNADVILNRVGSQGALANQVINNLVTIFPTENGSRFLHFLKSYLGGHLHEATQAAAVDQLDLQLAKHYLVAHSDNPNIAYFEETDINNVMFNQANYIRHIERFRKYRFVNIFAGGCPDNALSEGDLQNEGLIPES